MWTCRLTCCVCFAIFLLFTSASHSQSLEAKPLNQRVGIENSLDLAINQDQKSDQPSPNANAEPSRGDSEESKSDVNSVSNVKLGNVNSDYAKSTGIEKPGHNAKEMTGTEGVFGDGHIQDNSLGNLPQSTGHDIIESIVNDVNQEAVHNGLNIRPKAATGYLSQPGVGLPSQQLDVKEGQAGQAQEQRNSGGQQQGYQSQDQSQQSQPNLFGRQGQHPYYGQGTQNELGAGHQQPPVYGQNQQNLIGQNLQNDFNQGQQYLLGQGQESQLDGGPQQNQLKQDQQLQQAQGAQSQPQPGQGPQYGPNQPANIGQAQQSQLGQGEQPQNNQNQVGQGQQPQYGQSQQSQFPQGQQNQFGQGRQNQFIQGQQKQLDQGQQPLPDQNQFGQDQQNQFGQGQQNQFIQGQQKQLDQGQQPLYDQRQQTQYSEGHQSQYDYEYSESQQDQGSHTQESWKSEDQDLVNGQSQLQPKQVQDLELTRQKDSGLSKADVKNTRLQQAYEEDEEEENIEEGKDSEEENGQSVEQGDEEATQADQEGEGIEHQDAEYNQGKLHESTVYNSRPTEATPWLAEEESEQDGQDDWYDDPNSYDEDDKTYTYGENESDVDVSEAQGNGSDGENAGENYPGDQDVFEEDVVDPDMVKKDKQPTAPSSMVLFYTWMIVAILIMVVTISTYQTRCKGLRSQASKLTHSEDRKRLLEHEYA